MKKRITIEGMSCSHCVGHVSEALKEICGVENVWVNLDDKNATVELARDVEDNKLKEAVIEAGYDVIKIEAI